MAPPRKPTPVPPSDLVQRRYFIVNPAGCIHEVERDHAANRLKVAGWRMATKDEVAQLNTDRRGPNGAKIAAGEQRADAPICTPWTPNPDSQIDLEAE